MVNQMDAEKIKLDATKLANDTDSDILFYSGPIEKPFDDRLITACCEAKRRTNVLFILCTYGGDPDAGYRIARVLQKKYEKFTILIDGTCKSAGTLITVGANEVVMSDHAEIGPLDIQLGKKDELWETDSGLTVLSAIEALEKKSFDLFETCFLNLKTRSNGQITLKTATEMASKLAIGTISPIVAQIDPMHVGEVSRAMNIGLEYGKRLSSISKSTESASLLKLANAYPSHGFVIDIEEAKELFRDVREPTSQESDLLKELGFITRIPRSDPTLFYLSEEVKEAANEGDQQGNDSQGGIGDGGTIPSADEAPKTATVSKISGGTKT